MLRKIIFILFWSVPLVAQSIKISDGQKFSVSGNTKFCVAATSSGSSTDALENGLIAAWLMDETGGTRYDAVGNNDLTDNNTVLYGTGIDGYAADFERGSAQYLSRDDNADLSFGDEDFTFSCWVKFETDPNLSGNVTPIVSKYFTASNKREYGIFAYARLGFYVSNDGISYKNVGISSGTDPVADTWYNVVAWHNSVTDSIYVVINGGSVLKTAHSAGCNDNTSKFMIGYQEGGYVYLDGLVDLVYVWNRCPQSSNGFAMADSIYNGGAGWKP